MLVETEQLTEQPQTAQTPTSSPEQEYIERRERFRRLCDIETRKWERIANLRLYTFVLAAASLVWGVWQGPSLFWMLGIALMGAFVALAVYHSMVGRLRRRYDELRTINDEALKRIERRWDELPLRHSVRAQSGAPYAADLDIFGHASLFQLLETVSTQMGETALARWLQEFAPPETVRERQPAVAELAPLIDLRDELALRGRLLAEQKPDPARFLTWAESRRWLSHRRWIVWAARADIVVLWLLLLAQIFGFTPYPFWVILAAANFVFTLTVGDTIYRVLSQATSGETGFRGYAGAFELLSQARFDAPLLRRLQESLTAEDKPASVYMRRLFRLATLVIPRSSHLYLPIEALTLWDMHLLDAFERWQAAVGGRARAWLDTLGETEALAALSVLAHDNPNWAFPNLDPQAAKLEARDLGHPLLPASVRVVNYVTVGPPGTFLLVTGSNMSGKSTLLRAIGVNIVLAGAGGPVCASALSLPSVTLWTSMRVEDSLERGVSYFMAELLRLKQIVDAARACHDTGGTLFYLLDEILQGTNTAERQIAARRVIMYLVEQGALGAVSTHDLTIAEAESVDHAAHPVHFTETFRTGPDGPEMLFDYKLRPGIATSTNALRLMQIVGLDLDEHPPPHS